MTTPDGKSSSLSWFAEEGKMAESSGEMGNKIGNKEKEDGTDEPLPLCCLCLSSTAAVEKIY